MRDGHSQLERVTAVRLWGEGRPRCPGPALSGQLPELIPEEHAEDGVGAQAQVGGAQTLIERRGSLLPPDLHQAVSQAPVQPALGTDTAWVSLQGPWGPGWHTRVCLCVRASAAPQKRHPPNLGKLQNEGPLRGNILRGVSSFRQPQPQTEAQLG